jgi:hypothetical protein
MLMTRQDHRRERDRILAILWRMYEGLLFQDGYCAATTQQQYQVLTWIGQVI